LGIAEQGITQRDGASVAPRQRCVARPEVPETPDTSHGRAAPAMCSQTRGAGNPGYQSRLQARPEVQDTPDTSHGYKPDQRCRKPRIPVTVAPRQRCVARPEVRDTPDTSHGYKPDQRCRIPRIPVTATEKPNSVTACKMIGRTCVHGGNVNPRGNNAVRSKQWPRQP